MRARRFRAAGVAGRLKRAIISADDPRFRQLQNAASPTTIRHRTGLMDMPTPGPRRPLSISEALELVRCAGARSAILVEGWSDQAAVDAWAESLTVDLASRGVAVIPIGGITNFGKFASALATSGLGLRLSGLYDASEESLTLRSLAREGLVRDLTRTSAEEAGFFCCDIDLEDELIRALGTDAVEELLDAQGELASFRRFQSQPAQKMRDTHSQMKRFMGTRAGRKIRYGSLLVSALTPARVPLPLRQVLSRALD